MDSATINQRKVDPLLQKIADYVTTGTIEKAAYFAAKDCLADSLGTAILALNFPECTKLLGPIVPGTTVPNGARVPGTNFLLDPIQAAFNMGTMVRWLDYNDTWLAKEWGHPSDNLGGILSAMDFLSRRGDSFSVYDLLHAMIKAYEIQGKLALDNNFHEIGLDHVILVKVATTAVVTHLFGGKTSQIVDALSNAWIDGGPLRTYRHAPNTGSRKSWAAGDATSRGVWLAWMTLQGEMGYPAALSAKTWGVNDALCRGNPLKLSSSLSSDIIENVLFKVAYPVEFHAQTAVECAVKIHPKIKNRINEIKTIQIATQKAAMQIINKQGPLLNPADRDHCLQYAVAIALLFGELNTSHYEKPICHNPTIHRLREKMNVHENPHYTKEYSEPTKRSIANAITVHLKDGTCIGPVEVLYPLGHKRRRKEAAPHLTEKFRTNLATRLPKDRVEECLALFANPSYLFSLPVKELVQQFVVSS